MNSKHKTKLKITFWVKLLKIAIPVFLLAVLLKSGNTTKNIFNYLQYDVVSKMDTQKYKDTLSSSWPLIDTIYNSGNVNRGWSEELISLVGKIFSFDINKPLTILNTDSTILSLYYKGEYLPYMAQINENESKDYKLDYSFLGQEQQGSNGQASSISTDQEEKSEEATPEKTSDPKGSISIMNETKYKVDIDALRKEPLNLKFGKSGPKVLIYHTHTTESYINSIDELKKSNVLTNNDDPRYNMVRVGDELKHSLENDFSISVLHNGTVHDSPDYNSSYNNAYKTVSSILKSYPSIGMVLDIHRDAVEDSKLRLAAKVNSKSAAQIMFVVATGEIGLSHPNWKENLKLAIKLQDYLNTNYPGLARPIFISKYRYNQHVSNGALIVEIGGDGNTLDEAEESTKYLAKAINEVINVK